MATTARSQHASNGVLVAPPKGVVGGNRKKQKRRAKQAAKAVSQEPAPLSPPGNDVDYDEDPLGYADEDDYEYSDAEQAQYAADRHHYAPPHDGTNGHTMSAQPLSKKSKKKKKRSGTGGDLYDPDLPLSNAMTMRRGSSKQNIWNTTSQQERHNIRNFWLSLSEDERKSLLKIEKEAVLRKMKQQQKHSCSCTVCGRKRTAIEEELEVLYEGYYEELEQYAHHDHPAVAGSDGMLPAPLAHPHAHRPTLTAPSHSHHRTSQIMEHLEDDEAEYSDDEAEYSEEEYSDEELEPPRGSVPDFFSFGQNLTVKDNLLTVADDLLKNDGRKFIEMMEQLAERRMQRENEAEYAAQNPNHSGEYPPNDQGYANDDSMAPSDEFDDDDEASYDSQEDYDDELEDDDEMASLSGNPDLHRLTAKQNALTEEQRMQEGRRMFQIFAARMFEHRVLTAYKEKVAAERQQKLLEELQNEEQLEAQREAKKKRDAEKKKDKKKQQQAVKAEERAKKEAEKAAEESRLREAEERKQEELRQRKEEQRRKKEEERRKLEEERMKKEADRLRRQQEEQTRREEAERKIRESKAAEKARKEDARKKEKELKEARERKAGEEKDKQDRDTSKAKALTVTDTQPRQIVKRPSHTQMVAVPGVLTKQSPKPAAVQTAPRAATSRYKEASPQKPQSHVSSTASNSTSPGVIGTHNHAPKTILQKPLQMQPPPPPPQQHQQQQQQQLPFSHMHTQGVLPPPGMSMPMQQQAPPHHIPSAFSPLPPNNFQAFQQNQATHTMQGGMRSPMPGYPAPLNAGRFQPVPGMNGAHGPPPGIMASQGRGYGFDAHAAAHAPPGFGPPAAHMPGQTLPINVNAARTIQPTHSRQQSVNEKPFDPAIGQPIGRQAPIKRPSSAKQDENVDLDNLSKQLGSSALGGDDEPAQGLTRKTSQRNRPLDTFGSMGGAGSTWSTPFAPTPVLGQQWGALPQNSMSGWTSNAAGFGAIMPGRPMLHAHNRPLTIRIAVCQACQALSGGASQRQEYHDINQLLHFIDRAPPPLDSPPTLNEIELICETEGTEQNGGGELSVRKANNGTIVAVKWQPSNAPVPDAGRIGVGSLGEIGSPLPGKSTPAIGFGAPGMGRSSASGPSGSWHGHGGGF